MAHREQQLAIENDIFFYLDLAPILTEAQLLLQKSPISSICTVLVRYYAKQYIHLNRKQRLKMGFLLFTCLTTQAAVVSGGRLSARDS